MTEIKLKIQDLVKQIRDVFPQEPIPSSQDIILHECDECFSLKNDFSGYRWPEVPRKVLEIHYDDLPLFTPVAYHYYIPSYLSYSLQRIPPVDEPWVSEIPPSLCEGEYQPIIDFTIYSLEPAKESNWNDRYKRRFNQDQASVITDWLFFVLENSKHFKTDEEIARLALDKYWTKC